MRRPARRFTEVVCPPEVRIGQRTERVLAEFGLMLGALPSVARKALATALVVLDQGARLYPPSRGRRFARLDDRAAEAYIRALLARHGAAAEVAKRLRAWSPCATTTCPRCSGRSDTTRAPTSPPYPGAAWKSHGPQIRAGEAAVTARNLPVRGAGQP